MIIVGENVLWSKPKGKTIEALVDGRTRSGDKLKLSWSHPKLFGSYKSMTQWVDAKECMPILSQIEDHGSLTLDNLWRRSGELGEVGLEKSRKGYWAKIKTNNGDEVETERGEDEWRGYKETPEAALIEVIKKAELIS